MYLQDDGFCVKDPSEQWISRVIGTDIADAQFESEKTISCRLLWTVKLMRILGKVLGTMHSIKAETSARCRAELYKTQVPQLHNTLTSWYMHIPKELKYEVYASALPNVDQPPSRPTALMHMLYYLCLITLHRPYIRGLDNKTNQDTGVASWSSICIAAANNTGQILESLMIHGQVMDASYFTASCLLCIGMVFTQFASIQTPDTQRIALAGLCRFTKFTFELMKSYPSAEIILSSAIDTITDLATPEQYAQATEVTGAQINMDPLAILTQPQSTRFKDIYDKSRMTKSSMDGFGPARSVQLRHPSLDFSAPLADSGVCQDTANWQTQVASAIAVAATAFGAPDPRDHCKAGDGSKAAPQTLQLVPIEFMSVPSAVPQVPLEETSVGVDAPASAQPLVDTSPKDGHQYHQVQKPTKEPDQLGQRRQKSIFMEDDNPDIPSPCGGHHNDVDCRSASPGAANVVESDTQQSPHKTRSNSEQEEEEEVQSPEGSAIVYRSILSSLTNIDEASP
ncbi:hypothetical protein BGZ72_009658 [Mortierella alpina]|nr:hypothetical protein BGZ72_009658 [Mortierella alpina]